MPNAMNKLKPNQLIKVEKEIENKDIKRKLKSIQKEKIPPTKAETVWERLSKVKKCTSNENSIAAGSSKSRIMLATNQRFQAIRSTGKYPVSKPKGLTTIGSTSNTHAYLGSNKPKALNASIITTNTTTINTTGHFTANGRRVIEKRSAKQFRNAQPSFKEDLENIPYVGRKGKPVEELLTARSMCNSKSSSEGSRNSAKRSSPLRSARSCLSQKLPEERYNRRSFNYFGVRKSQTENMSRESFDVYEVAPLMPVPTVDSLTSSAKITEKFCSLLEGRKRTMPVDEIKVVKDCVKTDERHRLLQNDDSKLFKDILRTQLQEILKQETVLKSALTNLEDTVSIDSILESPLRMVDESAAGSKKPQVDVIFKNVPTLEKEIIILRALGEKLEATLKRTVSQGTVDLEELRSIVSAVSVRTKLDMSWMMDIEQNALVKVIPLGIRQQRGFVREYRIAHKTIVELKEQANRHFYLPSNMEKGELKRTSFRRLKENPDVLMRHLKPKNTLVPFNVLEQDPIFFNSYIYNNTPSTGLTDGSAIDSFSYTNESVDSFFMQPLHEGGDSSFGCAAYIQPKEPLKIEEIKSPAADDNGSSCTNGDINGDINGENKVEKSKSKVSFAPETLTEVSHRNNDEVQKTLQKEHKQQKQEKSETQTDADHQNTSNFEAPIRGKQRRRIRRSMTPVGLNKCLEPKNSLIKTIIVGAAQISVFLLLIMAITYPDVKC